LRSHFRRDRGWRCIGRHASNQCLRSRYGLLGVIIGRLTVKLTQVNLETLSFVLVNFIISQADNLEMWCLHIWIGYDDNAHFGCLLDLTDGSAFFV
jgi:hypothetical protein